MSTEKFEDFLPALRETGLVVDFIKKDGEYRTMFCTLNFDIIPKEEHPKDEGIKPVGKQKDFYRVFDVEKYGWRCIPKSEEANVRVIRVLEEGEAQEILENPEIIYTSEKHMPF